MGEQGASAGRGTAEPASLGTLGPEAGSKAGAGGAGGVTCAKGDSDSGRRSGSRTGPAHAAGTVRVTVDLEELD